MLGHVAAGHSVASYTMMWPHDNRQQLDIGPLPLSRHAHPFPQEIFTERWSKHVVPKLAEDAKMTASEEANLLARKAAAARQAEDTAMTEAAAKLIAVLDDLQERLSSIRTEAALLCAPMDPAQRQELAERLSALPAAALEAAVGLVLPRHAPHLAGAAPKSTHDVSIDLSRCSALELRQLQDFVRACEAPRERHHATANGTGPVMQGAPAEQPAARQGLEDAAQMQQPAAQPKAEGDAATQAGGTVVVEVKQDVLEQGQGGKQQAPATASGAAAGGSIASLQGTEVKQEPAVPAAAQGMAMDVDVKQLPQGAAMDQQQQQQPDTQHGVQANQQQQQQQQGQGHAEARAVQQAGSAEQGAVSGFAAASQAQEPTLSSRAGIHWPGMLLGAGEGMRHLSAQLTVHD